MKVRLNRIYKIEEYTNGTVNYLIGSDDRTWFVIAKNKIRAINMIMSEVIFKEHIGFIELIGYSPLKEEVLF